MVPIDRTDCCFDSDHEPLDPQAAATRETHAEMQLAKQSKGNERRVERHACQRVYGGTSEYSVVRVWLVV